MIASIAVRPEGSAKLASFQVSNVWLSQATASGAVHGAVTGTFAAMPSSSPIALTRSAPPGTARKVAGSPLVYWPRTPASRLTDSPMS